jgi:hypothetical protein
VILLPVVSRGWMQTLDHLINALSTVLLLLTNVVKLFLLAYFSQCLRATGIMIIA